ncbi:MAG: NAD(+) diphosphatase [Acidimicrobiales bacterium]|nr:NAD(+) diphosphatase [Acidimicrobiales bacterium]
MSFLPSHKPHPDGHYAEAIHILVGVQSVQILDLSKGDDPFDVPDDGGIYIGAFEAQHVYAHDKEPDAGMPLMALYGKVDDERWTVGGRAVQMIEWRRTHRYCGRCAVENEPAGPPNHWAMQCPKCKLLAFPRLAPAIIVLVTRESDGKALLARGANFPVPMYSCLAGFVEPGESMEQAVHREIREEVGIELKDVRYWGSQPWPFPHSLMLGFRATYDSGDLVLDETEIMDAQWHAPDDLPMIPPGMSIARRIIDDWVANG